MPVLSLSSALFDTLETVLVPPALTLHHQDDFDFMANGTARGDVKILQVSASLIRVSQVLVDDSTCVLQSRTFELRLSGSGISPVATLDKLMNAINNGLAQGTLSKVEIVTQGTSLLSVTFDTAGYHLTSGDIAVNLTGALPLTFTQFFNLADLFGQVVNINDLNRDERTALFSDLSAFSVSGLTLSEGGHVLFDVHVGATVASLTFNGLTLTANGTFPDNFGEDVQVLWGLFAAVGTTAGAAGAARGLAVTGFAGLTITGLTLTDAAGQVVGSMVDPLAETPSVTRVDGHIYELVRVGDNGNDRMEVVDFHFRNHHYFDGSTVVAGLGGRDKLIGGFKGDYLLGGTGNDTMLGNADNDRLDGGVGRDVMSGGTGADVFKFDLGDGVDRVIDFAAHEDVIRISDAANRSDLTFTRMGNDVMVDFRSIHILVDDITVAELDRAWNFEF